MNNSETLHLLQTTLVFGKEFPDAAPMVVAKRVLALNSLAVAVQNNAVALCNGDKDQEQYNKRKKTLTNLVTKHLDALAPGIEFKLDGDPRGSCLKIKLPSGISSGFETGYWSF